MDSKLFSILGSIVLLALVACAPANHVNSNEVLDATNIVNGKAVVSTDLYARHTVAIIPEGQSGPCTGVIIAPHFILSAGHCAKHFAKAEIYFGLIAKKDQSIVYKVKKITPHPKYCDTCMAPAEEPGDFKDYLLLEFEEDLPPGFQTVPVATLKQIKKGTTIHLAGFGIDENYKYDAVMKKTRVPLTAVGQYEFMTDETKTGSCTGDSGGPAFIVEDNKIFLAGITSRGDASCRKYGLYGIPAVEADWIKSVISHGK